MKLILPNEKYLASYTEVYDEYQLNNITTFILDDPRESDIIKKHENYRKGINLPEGRVPQITYWLVEDDRVIGQVCIRPTLNDALIRRGGNIGYGIRCSEWNKGIGTKLLAMGLIKAKEMGLKKVLITCNEDNYGSARVIEKNGGILQDIIENENNGKIIHTKRYWIEIK